MDEVILCESRTLRQRFCVEKNTCLLDRVGQIVEIPGTAWTTIENIAKFYIVGVEAIKSISKRHRQELKEDGCKLFSKSDFEKVHYEPFEIPNRGITIFPRRAVLRIGMILRDSPVAKLLRSYLLNIEESVNKNDNLLMKMANQLTQHSLQISKNVEELRELAQVSVDQSRMICAVVTEIYKNKEEIQKVQDSIKLHDCKMVHLENRMDSIEKIYTAKNTNHISQKQIQELQEKIKKNKILATKIWPKFRKHFQLLSYTQLPQERFLEAMEWIDGHF